MTPRQVAQLCYTDGGWRGRQLVEAVRIVLAESRGNPAAVNVNKNGSKDRGLWQFNDRTLPDDALAFDPVRATRAARALWDKRGWRPWYGRNNADPQLAALAAAAAAAVHSTVRAGALLPVIGVLTLWTLPRWRDGR